jgi:RNA polymerase sigma-70 factor (ECF subfamily)
MSLDEGFRSLYETEFDHVYRAVELLCRDQGVAEEATQEAFARALARWRRLRGQPWVAGWVTTTAINVARRQLRKRPLLIRPPDDDQEPESVLDLRTAIGDLSHRQQEAVVLHYLLGLPLSEVAPLMSCDEGTVKTHLSRARAALARALESSDDPIDVGGRSDE